MRRRLANLLCLFIAFQMSAQVTIIVEEVPEYTPDNATIFISGNFEGWSGGQKQYQFEKQDNIYTITLPKFSSDLQFKFTQGSWESVECDEEGFGIDNRLFAFNKVNDTLKVQILGWGNFFDKENVSTAANNVTVLSEDFVMPQLHTTRRIWLYLPPDYDTSNKSYGVLYMHDGQNLFDTKTSYAGEWEVDETLNILSKENKLELIVVGIDNGGEKRMDEYSPWNNKKYGGGEGDAYLEFIVNTLKPFIDSSYRTLPNKEYTGIMGSSMGGLISFYSGLKYPDTFGKIGVFSPSFWFASDCFQFAAEHSEINSIMYFLVGEEEGGNMVSDTERMVEVMQSNGFDKGHIYKKIVPKAQHNEQFWSSQFQQAVLWLYSN